MQHLDKFLRDCKEAGVWSKLRLCVPFIGESLGTAMVDITGNNSISTVNFVAGDYSEATGLLGDGATKYLDLNFNVNLLPVGCHLSSYNREDTVGAAGRYALGANEVDQNFLLGSTNPAASTAGYLGGNISATGSPYTKGFHYAERVATNDLKLYRNNAQIGTNGATATFTPPSLNLFAFARNVTGTPANYLNTRLSYISVGLNMSATERSDYYSIVQTLQINLGRAV